MPEDVSGVPEDVRDDAEARAGWYDLLLTVLTTLVLALLIRVFVAETYAVPTGSMLSTIQEGDRLVGEKLTLRWRAPEPGDIVFFDNPDGSATPLVKRVIATAGQTVDLSYGTVVVDGQELQEPYTAGRPSYPLDGHADNLDENVTFPYTVPEGCVWVMGDNRTNSRDSRYFGAVPVSLIKSKAVLIYWPLRDVALL